MPAVTDIDANDRTTGAYLVKGRLAAGGGWPGTPANLIQHPAEHASLEQQAGAP